MSWRHFTLLTPVAGILAAGLGIGLAVSACSSITAGSTASAPTTPALSAPASTASAPASSPVTPSSAPATTPSSIPATTPTPTGSATNAVPVKVAENGPYFVLWTCYGKSVVEPADYVLSCADDGNGFTAAHWTSWTPTGAAGVGTEYLNACIPNCAEGKIIDYPVDISLTGSYLASQNLPFSYAEITFTYLAARPTIYVTVNGKVEPTHPATWSPPLPNYAATNPPDK